MEKGFGQLEFAVTCLPDIRFLLKAWQRHLVREGLEASESGLVNIIIEDRLPGEEVKLVFQASEELLHRFLQSLEDQGLKCTCHQLIPGILTICRIARDRGVVTVIGSKSGGG